MAESIEVDAIRPDFEPALAKRHDHPDGLHVPVRNDEAEHEIDTAMRDLDYSESDTLSEDSVLPRSFETERPTLSHRAILFPSQSIWPCWIWLRHNDDRTIAMLLNDVNDDSECSAKETGSSLELSKPTEVPETVMTSTVCRNGILGCAVHDELTLYYRRAADFAATNQSISHTTENLNPLRWKGPVIACATLCDGRLRDMVTVDHRHVLDALSCVDLQSEAWLAFSEEEPFQDASTIGRVLAVRCDCDGERTLRGTPAYRSISLPRLHPQGKWVRSDETFHLADMYALDGINRTSIKSLYTFCLKIPIRTWHCDPDYSWTDVETRNLPASFLTLDLSPLRGTTSKDQDLVMKATLYRTYPGSVFFARTDGKPLLPEHVEALAAFARFVLLPRCHLMDDYDEVDPSKPEDIIGDVKIVEALEKRYGVLPGEKVTKKAILRLINPSTFKTFWTVYSGLKEWKDVVSPYDV